MEDNKDEKEIDVDALERDVSMVAPFVKAGFDSIGGPSRRVLDVIHAEAERHVKMRSLWLFRHFRALAAAASLAIIAGAIWNIYLPAAKPADITSQRTVKVSSTDEYAEELLAIQGMDQDTFFNPEESESSWL
jgi:hypothetical protein